MKIRSRIVQGIPTLLWLVGLIGVFVGLGQLVLGDHEPSELITDMQYLVDPGHDLTVSDVVASDQWRSTEAVPNFGFRPEAFWFRLQVDVDAERPVERLLELSYPILDSVQLHVLHQGRQLLEASVGDDRSFDERPVRHRNFVFPLRLQPGANTLILRIATDGVVQAPLTLWKPLDFVEFYEIQTLIDGAYFGVMVIMAFYNLILYLSIRERPFLYYVGHVCTVTLFLATMHGLAFMHLWPEWPWWQSHAVPVLVSLSVVFIALFVTSFLKLPRHSAVGRVFQALLGMAIVWTGLSLVLDYPLALRIASLLSITALTAALSISVWGWARGNRSARFLVLAWSAFVFGSIALAFNKLGLLPRTPFTESGMLLGSMLDVVFLSIAMADRVRQERRLREQAQARAMALEQRTRAGLEQAVAERTGQLEQAMVQLRQANRRLEDLSNIDELTGVYNRRYFDQALEFAWLEARQQGNALSLLLVDADRFKDVNDTYGHLAGDEVLRRMVRTIDATLGDRDHVLARIGGEELVLVMPGLRPEQAVDVAEAIRRAIEGMRVRHKGQEIGTTVSIGVSGARPGDETAEAMFGRADGALYAAKARGRNRVVLDGRHTDGIDAENPASQASE